MPHAGLMDEGSLGPVKGPLQRARLHIRGGKRRLRQGKISAGIVTLYDALLAAMEWYVNEPALRATLAITDKDDLRNEAHVYAVLVRSGILDTTFDFTAFDGLVEKALEKEISGDGLSEIVEKIDKVMTRLGVMPFDEALLPPEDPATF